MTKSNCQESYLGSATMTPTERPIVPFPSMVPTDRPIVHKVLLVDDDDAVRDMMTTTLLHKGFGVVAASNVTEALKLITTDTFDVLITDLHMPNPGDGFTVVTAMRHSQRTIRREANQCGGEAYHAEHRAARLSEI